MACQSAAKVIETAVMPGQSEPRHPTAAPTDRARRSERWELMTSSRG
jgi:hypothetical protein